MKKLYTLALFAVLSGCTDNTMARYAGGTATEKLPPHMKLISATWKDDSLWVLVRDMRADEKPERYDFIERSSFGVIQGKVVIQEQK